MPKILDEHTLTGNTLFDWEVKEYEQHTRGPWWYVIMLTLGLVLVGYGLFSGNFLFALIIILAAIILFLQSHQEAVSVPFAITELGVILNNRFYPYSEFDSFFIIYQPPDVKSLSFEPKSVLRPRLRIPLEDQNPVEIRHALLNVLSEDLTRDEEPMSDMIARQWRIH